MMTKLVWACMCAVVLFTSGCVARPDEVCDLRSLEAKEADNKVECEGGWIESWNPNQRQFRCAGASLLRFTLKPRALHLPSYTNGPQLLYITRGRGILGMMFPGCPESFEEAQLGSGDWSQQDRHQKLRHIQEGDIISVPAGVSYWSYNNGDSPLVSVNFMDVANHDNQLDRFPRRFSLAGNTRQEFQRMMRSPDERVREEEDVSTNVFKGMSVEMIQESYKVDAETARKMQGPTDRRGSIVLVKEGFEFLRPRMSREEQERVMRQEQRRISEREHARRPTAALFNGLEETQCTMKMMENIAEPSRADVFNPKAGRVNTVNSFNFPILKSLRLSAEWGFLYRNAMYAPHWNMNAHSVIYVVRGHGRCQVVDNFGRSVFEGELRQGQVLTVPQNFAVVKQAMDEGFEWISFKTNDNAKINQIVGRVSYIQALPVSVLANAYQISNAQARNLKLNRMETTLFPATSQTKI